MKNHHFQIAVAIMNEESFGLLKHILVLLRGCRLIAITLMKVTKRTMTSILEMTV